MNSLKLNIYKGIEIEKTYEVSELMYGAFEEFLEFLKNVENDVPSEVQFKQLKTLMMSIFSGLTEEEMRRTKISEIKAIITEAAKMFLIQIKT